MTYSPGLSDVVPSMVSPYTTRLSAVADERGLAGAPSSSTFESANRAVYVPILVPATCVIRRVWWANGSSVSATYNIDCGVYADAGHKPGAKLVSSGSTAQGTASQVQFVDVTDTALAPGRYWIALACSSASATIFSTTLATVTDAANRFEQSTAMPLPSTATPAEASNQNIYLCGFATTASP